MGVSRRRPHVDEGLSAVRERHSQREGGRVQRVQLPKLYVWRYPNTDGLVERWSSGADRDGFQLLIIHPLRPAVPYHGGPRTPMRYCPTRRTSLPRAYGRPPRRSPPPWPRRSAPPASPRSPLAPP